jgi:serine/threonine protein kinase
MKRFCLKCGRISEDGNRWCPEIDCPAEEGPALLDYGDYLGDVKVVRLLRMLRASAIYEGERGKQKVLLKVANPGDECAERLKREAKILAALRPVQLPTLVKAFVPEQRPTLPVLLPPYQNSPNLYGEITFRGERKVYAVFQHAKGLFLNDLLVENPQPWHEHAAWLVIDIADALRPLVGKATHLCLSPDMIMVDTDAKGYYRPLPIDLGLVLSKMEREEAQSFWLQFSNPAYTPPELITLEKKVASVPPSSDVYSLGMLLREMLVGQPTFVSKLARDGEVKEAVRRHRGVLSLNRPELPKEASGIVEKAVALSPAERFADLNQFSAALRKVFGRSPKETLPRPVGQWVVLIISLLLLLALVGILVASALIPILLPAVG